MQSMVFEFIWLYETDVETLPKVTAFGGAFLSSDYTFIQLLIELEVLWRIEAQQW